MDENKSLYKNLNLSYESGGKALIKGEIPFEIIEDFKAHAIKHYKETMELPGFRKGHVPEKIVVDRVGELNIIEDAAGEALAQALPKIIEEQKLDIIGRPSAEFTKISAGNPVEFKITAFLFPKFDLPDYKSIAKKTLSEKKAQEVDEKEISETIKQIKKVRNSGLKPEEKKPEDDSLSEEEIKGWGDFSSIEDFKNKLKENIKKEKERKERERIRLLIIEGVGKEIKIEIPEILVEGELNRMLAYFKDDVKRVGLKFEDYLKKVEKKEEDLKKEWRPDAENRVKFELILDKIGELEKINPSEEEINHETAHIKEHVSGTDENKIRPYVAHQIRTQKIFEFLENQK